MSVTITVGMRVRILCGDNRLGTVTAIEQFPNPCDKEQPINVPVITLDDNTVLHGYECWWEPISETPTVQ